MKYTSKHAEVERSAEHIFHTLSSFENFSPILSQRVEEWQATEERCSFKAMGFKIGLKMEERRAHELVQVAGDDDHGTPFPFTFSVHLNSTSGKSDKTQLHITLDVELNMMMKMMIGGKIQSAIDTLAEQIAHAFNHSHI